MASGQSNATLDRVMARPGRQIDLHRLLEETSRTLANIDLEHGCEMQQLERSRTDLAMKRNIAESLRRRHLERREPYVRLIMDLRHRIMAPSPDGLRAAS